LNGLQQAQFFVVFFSRNGERINAPKNLRKKSILFAQRRLGFLRRCPGSFAAT
jgi:hypothetical protein